MNTKLLDQKRNMQKAIDLLESLESCERIYGKIDPEYVKNRTEEVGREYSEIIKTLTASFLESAGMTLKVA